MSTEQRSLFDTAPPAWEADAADERRVATVVLSFGPPKPLDYLVPEALREQVQPGCRVRVPLGGRNREVIGYCVDLADQTGPRRPLKEVSEVVDRRSLLSPAMLRLTRWMAEHYMCGWAQVLDAVVPSPVRGQAGTRMVTLLTLSLEALAAREQGKLSAKQAEVVDFLAAHQEPVTPDQITTAVGCSLAPISPRTRSRSRPIKSPTLSAAAWRRSPRCGGVD
ncbi:MAG: hypothetical protein K8T25_05555 [Planctomycetia bacterium]|nr:hypothetical protein [Planctomycetia bacterium]